MAERILVIIQRSNGDVFLCGPSIQALHAHYPGARIDLLVNDDTLAIARTLAGINQIHCFSYQWKQQGRLAHLRAEWGLIQAVRNRYDLAINLTASDRSVLLAWFAGRISVSEVDAEDRKSWWKKRLLTHHYVSADTLHTVQRNLLPLACLGLEAPRAVRVETPAAQAALDKVRALLAEKGVQGPFLIFHPGAQYHYKVYPAALRDTLLRRLSAAGIPVVVTGSSNALDQGIKAALPALAQVHDLIGETSLADYMALSTLCDAYVGMDTLNMHIAAAADKRVFAIFGPSLIAQWSPWSNSAQQAATRPAPCQTYGKITLFQADMPCVPCGKSGCDNRHGQSDCLAHIPPETIAEAVITYWHTRNAPPAERIAS